MPIFKNRPPKPEKHSRSKYTDPSQKFLDFVTSLGLEKTFFGRVFLFFEERFAFQQFALIVLFSFVLASVIFFSLEFTFEADVGDIANKDIKSPIQIQLIDEETTNELRLRAEAKVPPVFDFNPKVFDNISSQIYRGFRVMRRQLAIKPLPKGWDREEAIKDFIQYKPEFEKAIGASVSDRVFEWLADNNFSAQIENILIRFFDKYGTYKVVDRLDQKLLGEQGQIVVRSYDRRSVGDEYTLDRSRLRDLARSGDFNFDGVQGYERLPETGKMFVGKFAMSLMAPNTFVNQSETSQRRKMARDAVPEAVLEFKPNQVIVAEGSVIQPVHLRVINEIQRVKSPQRKDLMAFAAALLFVVLIMVFFSFLRRFTLNKVRVEARDLIAMAVVALTIIVLTKTFTFVLNAAITERYGNLIPPLAFLLAAPVAAGPMMVGLLITSGEIVWLYSVFQATVISLMMEMNFLYLVVAIISGIAGARGVFNCKTRNDIYRAGIRVAIVAALTTGLLLTIERFGTPDYSYNLMWTVAFAFLGGIFSSFVAMMLIPLVESIFNYTTDVKLMELSNLNHPLMQEMIVRSPGTYHHSLVVGSMVEAAAQEIGANPLLAKVMAYYHDIGKMDHAAYFIENQKAGQNPHDHLSPHMSKTILIAHVKDGVELGMKYKLGKPIIDGVVQHHGTTLISYFYNKALEEQDEDLHQVEEEEFRYPGPKPQFREAALIMLADSIEAAARSLDEPTPTRLSNIVKNIVQRKFMDAQLDECNLNLRDLTVIENAFVRILLGIYHQRIDYPKAAGGKAHEDARTIHGGRKGANA